MLKTKIEALSKRHQMPPLKAFIYEAFIRLYGKSLFRSVLRVFIPQKKTTDIYFVTGCYNSGTTVIKNAIALHPKISIAPIEGDLLTESLITYENGGWPRCMVANCHEIMKERQHGYIDKDQFISDLRPWIKNKKIFLEKSISNTCRIPILRNSFSNTKFVCVTREAEGVIQGIQKRSHPSDKAKKLLAASKYPHRLLLRQWVFFYSLLLEDYKERSDDIYICSYEKFIQEPDLELKKIFNFLGLDTNTLNFQDDWLSIGNKKLEIRKKQSNPNLFIENSEQLEANIALNTERLNGKCK